MKESSMGLSKASVTSHVFVGGLAEARKAKQVDEQQKGDHEPICQNMSFGFWLQTEWLA